MIKHYETKKGKTGPPDALSTACDRVRAEFFNDGVELKDGRFEPILRPLHLAPTDRQILYWYRKKRHPVDSFVGHDGEREYNLTGRELMGEESALNMWPGKQIQLDATRPRVIIVSDLDPTLELGSPTLYVGHDVKTHLYCGIYVTIGDPSWSGGGMGCVENIAANKVEFCAQYGIHIKPEVWPCQHIADEYLADGGEYKDYDSDAIPDRLGSTMGNTGSYRADLKGGVERKFHDLDQELFNDLPGAQPSMLKRGERDPSKDACLTMREFIQAVIYRVIQHNTSHPLPGDYPVTSDMIREHVPLYPASLWIWGMANEGKPREMDPERVRAALLPRDRATITEYGIRFRKFGYDSTYAREKRLFSAARVTRKRRKGRARGVKFVQVAFDPRLVDVIYLVVKDGDQEVLKPCILRARHRTFAGKSWRDVERYRREERNARLAAEQVERQARAAKDVAIAAITGPAMKRKKRAMAEAANAPRRPRLGRRVARRDARQREDRARAWILPDARPLLSAAQDSSERAVSPNTSHARELASSVTPPMSTPAEPVYAAIDIDAYLNAVDASIHQAGEPADDSTFEERSTLHEHI